MIAVHTTDSPEALAAIAEDVPKSVWIHGSVTYVSTGADYTAPTLPEVVPIV